MRNQILGFLLATASMLYELILAQILNLSLGGTIFQYTITIGLYASSLGLGSLFYQQYNSSIFKDKKFSLFYIEIFLAALGILSLFFIYIIQHIFFEYNLPLIIFQMIVYIIIFLIGFLSGLELPLLMDINNNDSNSFSSGILFVDYLGTLMACIVFPLFFIPYFNLIETLFITAFINVFVSCFFSKNIFETMLSVLFIFIISIGIYFGTNLSYWLSSHFIS